MANNDTLAYVHVDYASQRAALIQRIRSRFPGVYSDFANTNFGTLLIDMMAWALSTLAYIVSRLAGENFVSTMTLRESAVRIGSLIGYQLQGPIAAVLSCEAQLPAPISDDVVIYPGTQISQAGMVFEVSTDPSGNKYVIKAGTVSPSTPVLQIDPLSSGPRTIQTTVTVTNASIYVDLLDTTIDLTQYVSPGQVFSILPDTGNEYLIQSVEAAPGAVSNNRIVLTSPYLQPTQATAAEVIDRRITLIQGQTVNDRLTTAASAQPGLVFPLSRTPVIDGSVSVSVNGTAWTAVNSLATQSQDATVFTVKTLTTGTTVVVFGDGSFGALLPTSAVVVATYRIGGGSAGNVAIGTIGTTIIGLTASQSQPQTVALTNQTAGGQGGLDPETLEQARANIPAYARTNDRAVTLEDYQTIATTFSDPAYGNVSYARSTIRTQNSLLEGNIVVIYAWTVGSGGGYVPLNAGLSSSLQKYLQTKAVGTDLVLIASGTSTPAPIALRYLVETGFTVADTNTLVYNTISSLINALKPGSALDFSGLVTAISGVLGVQNVTMATPSSDLVPQTPDSIFQPPSQTSPYTYLLQLQSVTNNQYFAQTPMVPLTAWSFSMTLGGNQLTVLPNNVPGQALLLGTTLDPENTSFVDLATGQVTLFTNASPGDLTMTLTTVQGYDQTRSVNIYVGYQGINTQATRRTIRAALQAWSQQFGLGQSMFSQNISGIQASASNITDVILNIPGVSSVTRVALDTPGSTALRLDSDSTQLLSLGLIVLNNNTDAIIGVLIPWGIILASVFGIMSTC